MLERLLLDKTTGKNILWATDAYAELGEGYQKEQGIEAARITGAHVGIITDRAGKALALLALDKDITVSALLQF